MKKLATLSLAALLLSSTAAFAQDFDDLDSDGNGILTFNDAIGKWPSLTREQYDLADMDNDGFINMSQYERLEAVLASGAGSPDDLPLFEEVDSDGDGQIAFTDLTIALPDVTQEEFDSADIDNDDFLDRTQYEALEM
jgi:hypothetical protein